MNRCIILSAISIVCRLRKLFRRHRQGRGAPAERLIVVDPDQVSQTAEPSSPPPGPSPSVDGNSGPQLVDDIQQDQPPLPPSCSRLQLGDIEILDEHPSCAGAFANIWNGSLAGDRVVVKSYRIYSTVDSTHARMRLYKEALACSRLSHQNIVPFRAAYTTPEYQLALVYDFMEHRDLREYLRNNRDVGRVQLLADIAQGLSHMHDLGTIHGHITTNNILVGVDGTARVAGLGSAFIPSQNHATWSEMDAELLFYGTAPELVSPHRPRSRIRTTRESDVYAFAILAWEVFAEQVPFSDIHRLAAIHLLTSGTKPPRPHHAELSDQVWDVIEKCWDDEPTRRTPIKDVAVILKAEISRTLSG